MKLMGMMTVSCAKSGSLWVLITAAIWAAKRLKQEDCHEFHACLVSQKRKVI